MINVIVTCLMCAAAFFMLLSVYLMVRGEWVYNARINTLHGPNGIREYERLPSFDTMMWAFWCWDVEKFKRQENSCG